MTTIAVNDEQTRREDAYFELEGDLNIICRQARLANAMLYFAYESVSVRLKSAEAADDAKGVTTFRSLKRQLDAAIDAATEVETAADRAETIYYT